jgi:hypothetical protein
MQNFLTYALVALVLVACAVTIFNSLRPPPVLACSSTSEPFDMKCPVHVSFFNAGGQAPRIFRRGRLSSILPFAKKFEERSIRDVAGLLLTARLKVTADHEGECAQLPHRVVAERDH